MPVRARLRLAVWALISHRSWRARWSAWYRKSGKLLPLIRQNSLIHLYTHKIHAQPTIAIRPTVQCAISTQIKTHLKKTETHVPHRLDNAAKTPPINLSVLKLMRY